ncbi:MAG: hypothetical protein JJD93_04445 [Ilumatobacteraceae bacterium]|nr:hypothetical protein [Ilumatobacteraceae bacterium]
MSKVIADISMSLDGYVAPPGAPILLGGGTPLFRAGTRQKFRQRDVRPSTNAVHLIYERLVTSAR